MQAIRTSILRAFILSAGAILLLTAAAKILGAWRETRVMTAADPIFSLSYRYLFIEAGALEAIAGLICLFSKRSLIQVIIIAWLSSAFLFYRVGLYLIKYQGPCPCLGSLTTEMHISKRLADSLLISTLSYMLIGSYLACVLILTQSHRHTARGGLTLTGSN